MPLPIERNVWIVVMVTHPLFEQPLSLYLGLLQPLLDPCKVQNIQTWAEEEKTYRHHQTPSSSSSLKHTWGQKLLRKHMQLFPCLSISYKFTAAIKIHSIICLIKLVLFAMINGTQTSKTDLAARELLALLEGVRRPLTWLGPDLCLLLCKLLGPMLCLLLCLWEGRVGVRASWLSGTILTNPV